MIKKKVTILGSTGSVGTQAADVCRKFGADVVFIAANGNINKLEEQIREFKPRFCAAVDERAAGHLKIAVADTDTKVYAGYDAMCKLTEETECDLVYNAVSGKNGLMPTLSALGSGKTLALANKESMVCAGDIVNRTKKEHNAEIIPVDSEHCAIFQCLKNGKKRELKRILLTASGGPFFAKKRKELESVSLSDALSHPTWKMGKKITVDSATLANKGLEIIEAMHLFGVGRDKIKVLIHRESIVHSMVEFADNSVIAQLSVPDMRYPAQYALTYPNRCEAVIEELDLCRISKLTFAEPDREAFPMLALAEACADKGGVAPCAYNAANEVAAELFLKGKLGFNGIYELVSEALDGIPDIKTPSLSDILETDASVRKKAYSLKEI